MKILVIEDEKSLSRAISEYFRKEGYICEMAADYRSGLDKIDLYDYDCVVLDLNLPGGNGLDLLKQLKKKKLTAGVIILSANDTLEDKLTGLELGSDDYLTKPFHLSELNARVKAIIRRKKFEGNQEIILRELRIDLDDKQVFVNDQPVVLTKREYELLLYLISSKNRIVTKNSISEHLWGDYMDEADSYDFIYSHVKNLRKKLLQKNCEDYIKTIYGIGYKFKV